MQWKVEVIVSSPSVTKETCTPPWNTEILCGTFEGTYCLILLVRQNAKSSEWLSALKLKTKGTNWEQSRILNLASSWGQSYDQVSKQQQQRRASHKLVSSQSWHFILIRESSRERELRFPGLGSVREKCENQDRKKIMKNGNSVDLVGRIKRPLEERLLLPPSVDEKIWGIFFPCHHSLPSWGEGGGWGKRPKPQSCKFLMRRNRNSRCWIMLRQQIGDSHFPLEAPTTIWVRLKLNPAARWPPI